MLGSTLIIGAAKFEHIRRCVAQEVVRDHGAVLSLLIHDRERGSVVADESIVKLRKFYFKHPLHSLSISLWRALLMVRPDRVVVVCGLYYDHENVVSALRSICKALGKTVIIDVFVQESAVAAPDSKTRYLSLDLIFSALYGIIALLLRAISPFVIVRAGEIFSGRIGHLAYDCEVYLCERELGRHKRCFDCFFLKDNHVANSTLCRMFARQMLIWPVARVVHDAAVRFHLDRHVLKLVTRRLGTARDPECIIPVMPAHLVFSDVEHAFARQQMIGLGLPPGVPYICLLGRDTAYLEWLKPFQNDGNLQEPRNIDINDYCPTAKMMSDLGHVVLRMGSKVRESFGCVGDGIIDYATHPARSDFLDIYLSGTCRFFIGSGSGLQEVPVIFRVPCVLINCFQFELLQTGSPQNILLLQRIYDNEAGRILRVDEVLGRGLGNWGVERFARSVRYRLLRNTPEEIQEAALEMLKRLDGTWQSFPEDEDLQSRFWSMFKPSAYNSCFFARIGTQFLRRHAMTLLPECRALN